MGGRDKGEETIRKKRRKKRTYIDRHNRPHEKDIIQKEIARKDMITKKY